MARGSVSTWQGCRLSPRQRWPAREGQPQEAARGLRPWPAAAPDTSGALALPGRLRHFLASSNAGARRPRGQRDAPFPGGHGLGARTAAGRSSLRLPSRSRWASRSGVADAGALCPAAPARAAGSGSPARSWPDLRQPGRQARRPGVPGRGRFARLASQSACPSTRQRRAGGVPSWERLAIRRGEAGPCGTGSTKVSWGWFVRPLRAGHPRRDGPGT